MERWGSGTSRGLEYGGVARHVQYLRHLRSWVTYYSKNRSYKTRNAHMYTFGIIFLYFCVIILIRFQEVVPLRAANVLGPENSKISLKWNSLIREALNKKSFKNEGKSTESSNQYEFRCIISKQMVGILISVWIRTELRSFVRNPSVSCVGCGIMGCLGNKVSTDLFSYIIHLVLKN